MKAKKMTRGNVWASIDARNALEKLLDVFAENPTWCLADNEREAIEKAENVLSYYDTHGLTEDDMPEQESEVA